MARGTQEPDPSKDVVLTIDGKKVTVPQGKPKDMPQFKGSNFFNSEYLVSTEKRRGHCRALLFLGRFSHVFCLAIERCAVEYFSALAGRRK